MLTVAGVPLSLFPSPSEPSTPPAQTAGHDWCIIKLAFPGQILGFDVDTSFFTGNFAPRCSVQAATIDDETVCVCVCVTDCSTLYLPLLN